MKRRFHYDLHIHSCLSPCADDEMTPGNIAGMASLAGINVAAVTDHNSARNCPAFFSIADKMGVVPVAGMELTTSEDIHVLCLFEEPDAALSFDRGTVYPRLIKIKNRTDVYGRQTICGEDDEPRGEEEYLLSNATDISYDEVFGLAERSGGICVPAHIDRQANSVTSVLGTLPETPFFSCAELHSPGNREEYMQKYGFLKEKRLITGSDAHFLTGIRDASEYFESEAETAAEIRRELFRYLRGE